jgi:hypothetical protein
MIDQNKQACYVVMVMRDQGFTPQARYFLIRLLYLYGSDWVGIESLKQDRRLGISDPIITKAIDLLEKKGHLKFEKQTKHLSSKQGIRVSDKFFVKLSLPNELRFASSVRLPGLVPFSSLIDGWLFEIDREDVKKANREWLAQATVNIKKNNKDPNIKNAFTQAMAALKKNQLSPANKILLSTLYSHADVFGVVRDLGSTDLLQLTGMDRDRLDRQFEKLTQLGYLLVRVPGLTGAHSFGLVKSVFYMNPLSRPVEGKYDLSLVMCEKDSPESRGVQMLGTSIYSENLNSPINLNATQTHSLEKIRELILTDRLFRSIYYPFYSEVQNDGSESLTEIADFAQILRTTHPSSVKWMDCFKGHDIEKVFQEHHDPRFRCYLQHKISEYASLLLTKSWNDIENVPNVLDEDLLTRIGHDIYPKSLKDVKSDKDTRRLEAVKLFIYRAALYVAFFYKAFIQWVFKDDEEVSLKLVDAGFMIVPLAPVWHLSSIVKWAILIGHKTPIFKNSSMMVDVSLDVPVHKVTAQINTSMRVRDFFYRPDIESDMAHKDSPHQTTP